MSNHQIIILELLSQHIVNRSILYLVLLLQIVQKLDDLTKVCIYAITLIVHGVYLWLYPGSHTDWRHCIQTCWMYTRLGIFPELIPVNIQEFLCMYMYSSGGTLSPSTPPSLLCGLLFIIGHIEWHECVLFHTEIYITWGATYDLFPIDFLSIEPKPAH